MYRVEEQYYLRTTTLMLEIGRIRPISGGGGVGDQFLILISRRIPISICFRVVNQEVEERCVMKNMQTKYRDTVPLKLKVPFL
jgi:hypothetical protein